MKLSAYTGVYGVYEVVSVYIYLYIYIYIYNVFLNVYMYNFIYEVVSVYGRIRCIRSCQRIREYTPCTIVVVTRVLS